MGRLLGLAIMSAVMDLAEAFKRIMKYADKYYEMNGIDEICKRAACVADQAFIKCLHYKA